MQKSGSVTVGAYLVGTALRYPSREAVVDVDKGIRLTYGQLNTRVNKLANSLLAQGMRHGDFVSTLMFNCAEMVEVYLALAKIGAVAAPLGYRLTPSELAVLINHSGSKALLYGAELREAVESIQPGLSTVQRYVQVGAGAAPFALDYGALVADGDASEPPVEVEESDPQYLNYTSGTTGAPKSYLLTHYNNAVALPLQFDLFDLTVNDRVLTVFPMFGRVGFAWTLMAIVRGATNVVMNFRPDRFLETVQRERISIANLVPTMAQMVLQVPTLGQFDLSSLRALVLAGSALPDPIREATWAKLCPNLFEYYGMQETAVITLARPDEKRRKPTSVGLPVSAVSMRIVDDQGRDVPRGTLGEIVARGPGTTVGYFKDPERTAKAITQGWFHTGDLAVQDEEGYVFLKGRSKDMIITGAQNVFAPEVESALLTHPGVADCAVIGLPDPRWVEIVAAVIVPRPGTQPTPAELSDFIRKQLAGFKVPRRYIFTDALPRNAAGKVLKFALVEQHKGAGPADATSGCC